jgi:hypothetical protein
MSAGWSDDPERDPKDGAEQRPRPSGQGLALCLGQLADEAAELGLRQTSAAIRQAIGACLLETADRETTGQGRMH